MAKAKKTTKAKTAKAKPKTTLHFDVSIQKVFEKMKAIVDNKMEAEFLQKCQTLKDHRFLIVNARIVKLVKEFLAEHELGHTAVPKAGRLGAMIARTATTPADPADNETCFKHRSIGK